MAINESLEEMLGESPVVALPYRAILPADRVARTMVYAARGVALAVECVCAVAMGVAVCHPVQFPLFVFLLQAAAYSGSDSALICQSIVKGRTVIWRM